MKNSIFLKQGFFPMGLNSEGRYVHVKHKLTPYFLKQRLDYSTDFLIRLKYTKMITDWSTNEKHLPLHINNLQLLNG